MKKFREWIHLFNGIKKEILISVLFLVFIMFFPYFFWFFTNLGNIDNFVDIIDNIDIDPEYFSIIITANSILLGFFTVYVIKESEQFKKFFTEAITMFLLSISIIYLNAVHFVSDYFTMMFITFLFILGLLSFINYYYFRL